MLNRIIGLVILGSTCFGTLYNNNMFLNAEYHVTTSFFSSFAEFGNNSNADTNGTEYAFTAYKMYKESSIFTEGISHDIIFENDIYNTKLILEYYFDKEGTNKETFYVNHLTISFNFINKTNNVFILDELNDVIRIYEDCNDVFYNHLIELHNGYKKTIV